MFWMLIAATWAYSPVPSEIDLEVWILSDDPPDHAQLENIPHILGHGREQLPGGKSIQEIFVPQSSVSMLRNRGVVFATVAKEESGDPSPAKNFSDGQALLERLAKRRKDTTLVQLGESLQGHPIQGLLIGQPLNTGAPVWRIVAGHHGDESSAYQVVLALADHLSSDDRLGTEIDDIRDKTSIWIVPFVNPDGVIQGTRYNSRGVDLNRNYSYQWQTTAYRSGTAPFSEPETRHVRAFSHVSLPMAGLSFHSGATNIGYVWNWTNAPTPEHDTLQENASLYASVIDDYAFYSTQGSHWYISYGDQNDWAYGVQGTHDYTVEVSGSKSLGDADLASTVDIHLSAIQQMLQLTPTLSGCITNEATGAPLAARIEVETHEGEQFSLFGDPVTGCFHRLMPASIDLTMTFSFPGFSSHQRAVLSGSTTSRSLHLALSPKQLRSDKIAPRSAVHDTAIQLPIPTYSGTVMLSRPGAQTLLSTATSGQFYLPESTSPGPWTVSLPTGDAWPNGLIVLGGGRSQAREFHVEGDYAALWGENFAPGPRAFILYGNDRPLREVTAELKADTLIQIPLSDIPTTTAVDLIVLVNGTWLSIRDILGEPNVDTGVLWDTGSRETGLSQDTHSHHLDSNADSQSPFGGCACNVQSFPRQKRWIWLITILLIVLKLRRLPCTPRSA